MTTPTVRLPGSPLARAYGATEVDGRALDNRPSDVNIMKTAMALGHLPSPRTSTLPTRADIARLRQDLDDAPDEISKSRASTLLDVAVLKSAMAADTLPPGVHARSPLNGDPDDRVDSEARRIPRFDPAKYAPSVDGINARGVQKTTPGAGGKTYADAQSNLTEIAKAAAGADVLLKLAHSMNRAADAMDARRFSDVPRVTSRPKAQSGPIRISVG